ncbi:MAG: glycyl-radical enzyme activator family protein [Firmicutes bacterium]|nr:glycyl-radical enzyme activator family protein [Bacillota bacterium]
MLQQIGRDTGVVFNIQKFSVHDGPGIRTLVFLKGCPLRCQWCSNPESHSLIPEVLYSNTKCITTAECGYCQQACKTGAITESEGKIAINRDLCTNCGDCAEACPALALEVCGARMTVDEVLDRVEEDSIFYTRSGGGITLSGGEPLVQADFAAELLKEAKQRGMDTAIETTGFSDWENIAKVLKYVDTLHFDIKCMDSEKHKKHTGVSNEKILDNFKRICAEFPGKTIVVRTPVIPGFNDTEEDILAVVDFLRNITRPVEYELMGYHRFGEGKYAALGKTYPLSGVASLDNERLVVLEKLIKLKGAVTMIPSVIKMVKKRRLQYEQHGRL